MAKAKQKQKRERPFEVSRLSPGLIGLNVLYQRNKDFEFWVLLRGDGHCDNPASNIDAQIKHLDQAKERGAAVIDIGDQFDAMQGKNDPRVLQVESDEMVAAIRANGVPVEYIVFDDEGHGFRKKENQVIGYKAVLEFLEKYLRGSEPG